MRLSAVVLAYNEKPRIARCIEALRFCDEIIVVDDGSTDGTWELLGEIKGIVAVQHRHTTFAAQREYGKSLAKGRWLLSMDADEYVTPELAKAIEAAIDGANAPDGFFVQRKNPWSHTLAGHMMSWHPRLVQREKCRWVVTDSPHAPLDMAGLRIERLAGGWLDHEAQPDLPTALRKAINRNVIQSAQVRAAGKRASVLKLCGSTVVSFLRAYFVQGAWRFGGEGVVWAGVQAFHQFCRYSFLFERYQEPSERLQDGGAGSYPRGTSFVTDR